MNKKQGISDIIALVTQFLTIEFRMRGMLGEDLPLSSHEH